MELWRDVRGYEGLYQVSNYGRVRSLDRVIVRSNGIPLTIKGNILTLHYNRNRIEEAGHLQVWLQKNGVSKPYYVHRLVAEAFLPNPNAYTVVHHKDHNPENNMVENLEWMTEEEHKKLHTAERKIKLNKRVDQIDKISGEVLHQWESVTEAAIELGCCKESISGCAKGKKYNKTCKGYVWKYIL